MEEKTKTVDSFCRGCIYLAQTGSGDKWCDYIGAEGHCRPCPAGRGCTARRTGKETRINNGKE